jgi:hypothetical protein
VIVAAPEPDGATVKSCPNPVRAAVCGLSLALSTTVRTPFLVPLVVGSKTTAIEQLAPGARLLPQLLCGVKSAGLAVTLVMVSVLGVVFVSVSVCGGPDVPTY